MFGSEKKRAEAAEQQPSSLSVVEKVRQRLEQVVILLVRQLRPTVVRITVWIAACVIRTTVVDRHRSAKACIPE